jgi:hypothetical protein
MRKLLLIIVFLLVCQVDILATMNTFDFYGSISYSDLDVNSPAIIIDTPLYVPGFWNINNDGYWQWDYTDSDLNARPNPEPTTMFLLGTGLIALGWVGRKKLLKGKIL